MQRKNSILRTKHKNGIAMIMAVTVIVIIATIMALALSLTTQTAKRSADLYLYEQAAILSHSAAEYAILEASRVNPCSYDGDDFRHNDTFDINISMKYISVAGTNCNTNAIANNLHYATTTRAKTDATVMMDITVTANPVGTTEPIRYFRRSIQKL